MAVAWLLSRRTVHLKRVSRLRLFSKSISTHPDKSQIHQPSYFSPLDAEPLHHYRQGGYHPVNLGNDTYITVKICVAESHGGETRASKSEQIGISSPLSRTFGAPF
ncbi:Protein kinase [Penicillium digitatum PHI26]|uniref:Protein kinase n=2 Tax=Penicillium digitatum TaxID=36651 RepID=K9GUY5_PEND2|nr:Protein kinase [Penicillium digitatum Pd1]EKV11543.1 Protein kinase [Penicillium digitatum Pd1]EKV16881.1 Protein kinase [Penicillium digitatum PHI26]